ncbi:hypothetical protein K439DRAFT_1635727 [Ramaria rubella]|nr:hypothetical protein K439DRAFT_1635727 [Ramaria rubella]
MHCTQCWKTPAVDENSNFPPQDTPLHQRRSPVLACDWGLIPSYYAVHLLHNES